MSLRCWRASIPPVRRRVLRLLGRRDEPEPGGRRVHPRRGSARSRFTRHHHDRRDQAYGNGDEKGDGGASGRADDERDRESAEQQRQPGNLEGEAVPAFGPAHPRLSE